MTSVYSRHRKKKKINTNLPVRTILFARVSSREQERGDSIDAQLKSVRDYAERNKLEVVKEYAITESSSKGDRKRFYEMLDFIEGREGKFIIVVNTIDRIQRRFHEYIELDVLRLADKIEIHFIRENIKIFKKSNSFEIGSWTQGVMWAQQYVMQSSDNIKRANDLSRDKGRWLHQAPPGYENYTDENGQANVRFHPVNAPIVKKMFETYAKGGASFTVLVLMGRRLGLITRQGAELHKATIAKLLKNPFYYGVQVVDGVRRPHIHGNLISKELFDKVQEVRNNKVQVRHTRKRENFIYSAKICCGTCGNVMSPYVATNPSGREYVYLRCNKYHGNCNQRQVNENVITEQLFDKVLNKFTFPASSLKNIQLKFSKYIEKQNQANILDRAEIVKQLGETENRLSKLLDLMLDGVLSKEDYDIKKGELTMEQATLNSKLKVSASLEWDMEKSLLTILKFAENLAFFFKSSIVPEKQAILKILLSNSFINDVSVCFNLKKPFDLLLKKGGSILWWGSEYLKRIKTVKYRGFWIGLNDMHTSQIEDDESECVSV